MIVKTISTAADFEQLKAEAPVFLADFYKDNCINCKMLELSFQKLAQKNPQALEGVTLAKLKLEELGEDFFRNSGIRQAPTLLLFKSGAEQARFSGFIAPEKILELLEQA